MLLLPYTITSIIIIAQKEKISYIFLNFNVIIKNYEGDFMDNEVRNIITDYISTKPDTINTIVAVNNTQEWNQKNYSINKSDYCKRGYFYLKSSCSDYLTKINYISYLKYHNSMFKIGIINKDDLEDDLINWRHGVMSGRFQKPIELIKTDDSLNRAIKIDRLNALRASLILLAESESTEFDLYHTICSLSYIGDIRMKLKFENPNKISNIVNGSFEEFKSIYDDLNDNYYTFDPNLVINTPKVLSELKEMPATFRDYLLSKYDSIENFDRSELENLKKLVYLYFENLNLKPSIVQPIKGIMSNSCSKVASYALEKRKKAHITID